jgi:hypothetical protein
LANWASVKRGIEGKRISKGEEFLIEKKNSLEIPPDFGDLPPPKKSNDEDNISLNEETNIEKLFKKNKNIDVSKTTNTNTTTEKSILRKIKKN